jgi:hypothetical protein
MQMTTVLLALLLAPATEKVDLKGVVHDDAGAPVKNATVLILTARPRKGVATVCPSCYLDCWRQTTTDARGEFAFEKVDGSLVFQVGAATPTHETAFANKVDPIAGGAQITLYGRAPLPDEPARVVRGQLVDLGGKPVPHAVISPEGYRLGSGRGFGAVPGIPSLTITDEKGAFSLSTGKVFDAVILKASARGMATTALDVPTGGVEQRLTIGPGSAVKGRLTKDGKPVAGVTLGIAQLNRSSETYVGERTAVTNAEGRFVLANVSPRDLTVVYGKMQDCGPYGAVPVKYVETTDHDGVVDVGDLRMEPGARLSGRVVLPEGSSVPPDSSLTAYSQTTMDFVVAPVAADGTFTIEGLPHEPLTLSTGLRGYHLSRRNLAVSVSSSSIAIAPIEGARELTLFLEPQSESK